MRASKHVLGLHTKEERKHAYTLVSHIYQFAMLRHDVYYALGYVDAVLDLMKAEASGDEELVDILVGMRDALLEKSAV